MARRFRSTGTLRSESTQTGSTMSGPGSWREVFGIPLQVCSKRLAASAPNSSWMFVLPIGPPGGVRPRPNPSLLCWIAAVGACATDGPSAPGDTALAAAVRLDGDDGLGLFGTSAVVIDAGLAVG